MPPARQHHARPPGHATAEPVDPADITASGEALRAAQRLLGIHDVDAALADGDASKNKPRPQSGSAAAAAAAAAAGNDDAFFAARPAGLGLGADYLPHAVAMRLTAGVERELGKRLGKGREGGGGSEHRHAAAHPSDDDSDDEGGRATAVGRRRRGVDKPAVHPQPARAGAVAAAPLPTAAERAALLAAPIPGVRKKKKKKKGKALEGL